jgi:hypothetical protein
MNLHALLILLEEALLFQFKLLIILALISLACN